MSARKQDNRTSQASNRFPPRRDFFAPRFSFYLTDTFIVL